MPPVGVKPTLSAGDGPQTYALDRADTGIGKLLYLLKFTNLKIIKHSGIYSVEL
jgi:hypothetical protein